MSSAKIEGNTSRDQSDSGTSTFLWNRYLLFISFLIRIQYSDKDIGKFLQKSIFVLLRRVYFVSDEKQVSFGWSLQDR